MRNKTLVTGAVLVLGCVANADVVLNQISNVEADNFPYAVSQDFETAFDTFDTAYLDDFTVTSLQLNVIRVEAIMALFTGGGTLPETNWANVTGFRVEFYTSIAAGVANLTGNAGSASVPIAGANRNNLGYTNNTSTSYVDLSINVNLPFAGTFWVAVMGVMPGTASLNQVGPTQNGASPGNTNATWVNPGGGFISGGGSQNSLEDASYRVNAIPEPASLIALGIGAAALLARRRRKIA